MSRRSAPAQSVQKGSGSDNWRMRGPWSRQAAGRQPVSGFPDSSSCVRFVSWPNSGGRDVNWLWSRYSSSRLWSWPSSGGRDVNWFPYSFQRGQVRELA